MNYPNLLSPVRVRGLVLKNRMTATTSLPHFLQGPESYVTKQVINHLADRARNGAAVVTLSHTYASIGERGAKIGKDTPHFPVFDMYDPQCQNYLIMLCDAIHYYGSKACLNVTRPMLPQWDVVDRPERGAKAYTEEIIEQFIDCYVEQAVIAKELGFDIVSVHFAYRSMFAGALFSPITNTRTDRFGGSLENRSWVILEIFRRIKAACGEDFVTEGLISAVDLPGGYTFEDTKKFARLSEGLIDILQVRDYDGDPSHPTGFNPDPNPTLNYAAELKALGLKTLIAPVGGFQDPAVNEAAIAEGKADLIAMARTWVCEPEYGRKLAEGRAEDIVPCVRCNKCHVIGFNTPFRSACTVNPAFGVESYLERTELPVTRKKRVAVIGGGVAGMEAATLCARRGHDVTLYERTGALGGQLLAATRPDFKWPLGRFLEYMVRQTEKAGVQVELGRAVTPDEVRAAGFDAVVSALGGAPVVPPIPGAAETGVLTAVTALLEPERTGDTVVVIGGGEIGVETGMYLGKMGKRVQVLEMQDEIAPDCTPIHYRSMFQEAREAVDTLTITTGARVTGVAPDGVTYETGAGERVTVPADTVVVAAGTRPAMDEALKFSGCAQEFYTVGDCAGVGTVMTAMRAAYGAANQI